MSILCTCGFERQELVAENILLMGSGGNYSSFVHGSGSTRSYRLQAASSTLIKPLLVSSDELWLHVRVYFSSVPNFRIGFSSGSNKDIYMQTNASSRLAVFTGSGATPASTELDTGSVLGNDQWYNLHFHIKRNATGFFRCYINGNFDTPDVEYSGDTTTVINASFTNLIMSNHTSNSNYYMDDIIVMDPTDATGLVDPLKIVNPVIKVIMPDGDGAKQTQASGDYTDIDELPPSGSDSVSFDAVGQESTFTTPSQSGLVQILGKTVWARVFRNDASAGENIELEVYDDGSGNEVYSDVLPAPSDGAAEWTFELDANGDTYNASSFNSEQFGFRTVT